MSISIDDYVKTIKDGYIPISAPSELYNSNNLISYSEQLFNARMSCNEQGVWPVLALDWIKDVLMPHLQCSKNDSGYSNILEIFSGRGHLKKALMACGFPKHQIISTDDKSWPANEPLTYIINKDATHAIRDFGDQSDILLCSWPPYDTDDMHRAFCEWGETRPIIYIGEWSGCNGQEEDFKNFNKDTLKQFDIPQWPGIHDYVWVGHYQWRETLQDHYPQQNTDRSYTNTRSE